MEASHAGLQLPNPDEHIPYTVVDQQPRQLMQGNRFVDVMEVSYEGPSHVVDTVTIPASEYDPAAVDRTIQEKLHRVEGVAALGAVPHPENLAAGA